MTRTVSAGLKRAGLSPRDNLDVYDFMWTTLRPSARKQLERGVVGVSPATSSEAVQPAVAEQKSQAAAA